MRQNGTVRYKKLRNLIVQNDSGIRHAQYHYCIDRSGNYISSVFLQVSSTQKTYDTVASTVLTVPQQPESPKN